MSTDNTKSFDLFLSHNWGKDSLGRDNHNRVAKLNDALKKAHVITWFDAEQLGGHIGQAMTDGIDSCEQVAVFVTRRYIDKVATKYGLEDNCRLEFDYSARRRGISNLIPIVMEPKCLELKTWNGVLGASLANQMYIDFTEDDKLDTCVREILKRVHAKKLNTGSWYSGLWMNVTLPIFEDMKTTLTEDPEAQPDGKDAITNDDDVNKRKNCKLPKTTKYLIAIGNIITISIVAALAIKGVFNVQTENSTSESCSMVPSDEPIFQASVCRLDTKISDAMVCVADFAREGACDWDHWSEIYSTCKLYDASIDTYLLPIVQGGQCTCNRWTVGVYYPLYDEYCNGGMISDVWLQGAIGDYSKRSLGELFNQPFLSPEGIELAKSRALESSFDGFYINNQGGMTAAIFFITENMYSLSTLLEMEQIPSTSIEENNANNVISYIFAYET